MLITQFLSSTKFYILRSKLFTILLFKRSINWKSYKCLNLLNCYCCRILDTLHSRFERQIELIGIKIFTRFYRSHRSIYPTYSNSYSRGRIYLESSFCFLKVRQSCETFIELDYILARKVLIFAMRTNVCNCSLVAQLRQIFMFFALNIKFRRFEQTLLLGQIWWIKRTCAHLT